MIKYSKVKNRLFDNVPQAPNMETDFDPLYSSFTKDNVFVPPTSSKDIYLK
jgi:hypothetical protein